MAAMSIHNKTVLASLEEGDLVEFPRKNSLFSHWAVYVGNEEVVHLAPTEDGSRHNSGPTHISSVYGKKFPKAQIKREKFWDVVKKSKAKKNNKYDNNSKYSPRPKRQIVEEALTQARESLTEGYNLLYNNCEHFASWCRYEVKKSDQVEFFTIAASVGATVVVVVTIFGGLVMGAVAGLVEIIGGIGLYLYSRKGSQKDA